MQQPLFRRIAQSALLAVSMLCCASAMALEQTEVMLEGQSQTFLLQLEIASTAQQRAFGLMERERLDDDAGMLFIYESEQPPQGAFWMYRTRIALDIAFLGPDGEIRAIRTMPPCKSEVPSECPVYIAGVPFHAALEVNAGYFEARGINVGDRLVMP